VTARPAATVLFGEALVDDFGAVQVVGGAPFNVARHLAAFGEPQLLITRIGNDRNGELVRAEFARFGMAQDGVQVDAHAPTGRVVVEMHAGGHRFHILPAQAYDAIDSGQATGALAHVQPSTLYFGTLAQRAQLSRDALHALAGACIAATGFADLNLREGQVTQRCVSDSLDMAGIVKVNEEELATLLAWHAPHLAQHPLEEGCRELMAKFGLDAMLVTLGERGAAYFGCDGSGVIEGPGPQVEVADTVGAGDACTAVFLLGRSRGWTAAVTLARANAFAGAICSVPGAVPAGLGFYQPWRARWGIC
jgi:fructokinase